MFIIVNRDEDTANFVIHLLCCCLVIVLYTILIEKLIHLKSFTFQGFMITLGNCIQLQIFLLQVGKS